MMMLVAVLGLALAPIARAQTDAAAPVTPTVEVIEPIGVMPAALPALSGTAAAADTLKPADWIKLGKNFGSRGQWQVGFDKSATAGSCAFYAVRAKFLMAGPCRDVLLLAKDARPVFHLGGAALYSSSHQPGYLGRAGFNVGPAAAGLLTYAADRIPYVEAISDWKAPKALAYAGKITTFDYSAGVVNNQFDHGPQVMVNIPLPDLRDVLGL
jgi:hypothetical protein